jgi:epoxyqueuosine reductase
VLALDDAAFRERFRRTALWRARRAGLRRNAAIVLGNRGDIEGRTALSRALGDDDPAVRDAVSWALSRLSPVG